MMISWPTSASRLRWAPRTPRNGLQGIWRLAAFRSRARTMSIPRQRLTTDARPLNLLAYVQSLQARVSPAAVARRGDRARARVCALAPRSDRSHLRQPHRPDLPQRGVTSRSGPGCRASGSGGARHQAHAKCRSGRSQECRQERLRLSGWTTDRALGHASLAPQALRGNGLAPPSG